MKTAGVTGRVRKKNVKSRNCPEEESTEKCSYSWRCAAKESRDGLEGANFARRPIFLTLGALSTNAKTPIHCGVSASITLENGKHFLSGVSFRDVHYFKL